MDALKRPLRIPMEFSRYAEEKGIFELYELMLKEILVHKPEDPLKFLHEFLGRKNHDVPKVIIYGPPVSGQCTVSKLAARKLKGVHVSAGTTLKEDKTQDGIQAKSLKESGKDIPDQLWAKIVKRRLAKEDCKKRGWVLEGFPKTRLQALALQMEGIMASHFVHLTIPDAVLKERYSGKRVDPITGDVYHQVFVPPKNKEVAQRLALEPGGLEENVNKPLKLYHRHCQSLLSCYEKVAKTFNSDQPIGDLFAQVYTFLCTVGRSCSPRIPRVILIGPTGSGKSLQAAELSRAYNLVEVDCKLLIKQALASETKAGLSMKPFYDRRMPIPDDMVMAVLTKRLSQLDVMTQGFVLHGFPFNRNQAELLANSGHNPNRVFFLNVPEESIEERLTLRRIDPETGERYHLLFKPPPSQEVKNRLKQQPGCTKEKVQERIHQYNRHIEDLMAYYDWGQHVNGDQDPLTVFEHLEGNLIESLPKQPPPSLEELSTGVNI